MATLATVTLQCTSVNTTMVPNPEPEGTPAEVPSTTVNLGNGALIFTDTSGVFSADSVGKTYSCAISEAKA